MVFHSYIPDILAWKHVASCAPFRIAVHALQGTVAAVVVILALNAMTGWMGRHWTRRGGIKRDFIENGWFHQQENGGLMGFNGI